MIKFIMQKSSIYYTFNILNILYLMGTDEMLKVFSKRKISNFRKYIYWKIAENACKCVINKLFTNAFLYKK